LGWWIAAEPLWRSSYALCGSGGTREGKFWILDDGFWVGGFAISNQFSVGVGLHSSKRKLTLPCEAAWELSLRAEAAGGCLDEV
jgi:hypothetical protein